MNGFVSDENREIPACSSSFFFFFFFSAAFFYVAFLSTSMEKILSSLVLCFVHVCVFLMCSSITSASANNAPRGILFFHSQMSSLRCLFQQQRAVLANIKFSIFNERSRRFILSLSLYSYWTWWMTQWSTSFTLFYFILLHQFIA